jgi:hypothetical protein
MDASAHLTSRVDASFGLLSFAGEAKLLTSGVPHLGGQADLSALGAAHFTDSPR